MTDDTAAEEPRRIDWGAVERDFRAGVLSGHEIARQHGCSETAIRKRARRKGWTRDLSQAVRAEAQDRLTRELAEPEAHARSDREIVEAAAATQVEVVRGHRAKLSKLRVLADRLLAEVDETTGRSGELAELIDRETADDSNDRRSAALHRAVGLSSRVSAFRELVVANHQIQADERQAFSIDAKPEEADAAKQAEGVRLAGLVERWNALGEIQKARALGAYIEERMRAVKAGAAALAPSSQPNPES